MRSRLAVVLAMALMSAGCASTTTGTGVPGAGGTQVSTGASQTSAGGFPTPSTSSASGSGTPADLAQFVGEWFGHGRLLTIAEDGTGEIVYRTYTFCGPGVAKPCDPTTSNGVGTGGKLTLAIQEGLILRQGRRTVAAAVVRTSNDPQFKAGTAGLLVLADDVITVEFFAESTFCGSNAAPGACGA